jgi:hypothetical protein
MASAVNKNKKQDRTTRKLEAILREHFLPKHPEAQLDVYRYNSASIRIRVVDPEYAKKDLTERDDEIWEVLKKYVDRDTKSQISLILLFAPEELAWSSINREFENPTPSRL